MHLSFLTKALVLLLSSSSSYILPSLAWTDLGHRTVAYVAYAHLTPETRTHLDSFLAYEASQDFSDAAVWADWIKEHRKGLYDWAAPWHYIGKLCDGR
jgi:hypothetical protein